MDSATSEIVWTETNYKGDCRKISGMLNPNGGIILLERMLGMCEDTCFYPVDESETPYLTREYLRRLKEKNK